MELVTALFRQPGLLAISDTGISVSGISAGSSQLLARFEVQEPIIKVASFFERALIERLHQFPERRLHNFGQWGKWNFCLTTGTLVLANQEHP